MTMCPGKNRVLGVYMPFKIETQESIKILAVTLDRMLSFKEHIALELKKAYAKSHGIFTQPRNIAFSFVDKLNPET